jgi:hypothetical protein
VSTSSLLLTFVGSSINGSWSNLFTATSRCFQVFLPPTPRFGSHLSPTEILISRRLASPAHAHRRSCRPSAAPPLSSFLLAPRYLLCPCTVESGSPRRTRSGCSAPRSSSQRLLHDHREVVAQFPSRYQCAVHGEREPVLRPRQ